MAKRKIPRLTPEDHARQEKLQRMVRERMAYHEAKAREEDERRAAKRSSLWGRLIGFLGRTP